MEVVDLQSEGTGSGMADTPDTQEEEQSHPESESIQMQEYEGPAPALDDDFPYHLQEAYTGYGAPPEQVLSSLDLDGIAEFISSGKAKKIVTMCGAGISVSAGIPDFRSAGTGLYATLGLEGYNLQKPEHVFTLSYFRKNPAPFNQLVRKLFPGAHKPTVTHYFITLLYLKKLLLRCFTQNIDSLETTAGLPSDMCIAAHGNFDGASCIKCKRKYSSQWVKDIVLSDKPLEERICRCTACKGGLVKPDITFFEEAISQKFYETSFKDMPQCDLLIVMGTSLAVEPFNKLLCKVKASTPRLLINRQKVAQVKAEPHKRQSTRICREFQFQEGSNYRDVLYLGNCDEGVRALADKLGWRQELEQLMAEGHAAIDARNQEMTGAAAAPESAAAGPAGAAVEAAAAAAAAPAQHAKKSRQGKAVAAGSEASGRGKRTAAAATSAQDAAPAIKRFARRSGRGND